MSNNILVTRSSMPILEEIKSEVKGIYFGGIET